MLKRQIGAFESPSCAVLVLSCDGYRDLWTPFFTLFERYWPDCGLPVYLGANNEDSGFDWVQTLTAGDGSAWSRRLRFFLENLPADYILLLLEDFFLDRPVSTQKVNAQLQLLHARNGTSLRLFPNPPADYIRNGIGILHSGAAYRVSLQAAIWNRRRLMDLLVDEESPWEFEWRGTRRSRTQAGGFFCASESVIHYRHVVERGSWFRDAARFYASQPIGCNWQARPVMGVFKTCRKVPANLARRLANRLHSCWLCLARPEKIPDGL